VAEGLGPKSEQSAADSEVLLEHESAWRVAMIMRKEKQLELDLHHCQRKLKQEALEEVWLVAEQPAQDSVERGPLDTL
jgi:hypothetical protein